VPPVVKAAIAYVAIVFAAGFAMGTLRVLLVAPAIGELAAVAAELPVLLIISWLVCKVLLVHFQVEDSMRQRLAMGAIAFVLLMAVEFAFATLIFGQTMHEYLGKFANPAAILGLIGQMLFSAVPVLQRK
jgi:hypothetical protein